MGPAGTQGPNADGGRTTAPAPIVLQLVASAAGTVIGEAIGATFAGKLVTGLVGAAAGAFLTAPGSRHPRRIVAVALFAALLAGFRRVADAQAAPQRRGGGGSGWQPANWAAVALTAVAGFAVGSGITAARGGWDDSSSKEAQVTVPEVRGQPRSDALQTLEDADLQPASSEEPSESIPGGVATRTDPRAGSAVDEGAAVRVFVSSGPPPPELRVPDVLGLPRADALRVLNDAGLRPTTREGSSDSVAEGLVTGTDPPARTPVRRGAEVIVLISSGPPPVQLTVPNLVGQPRAQAIATLQGIGLRPSSNAEESSTVPAGLVIRTVPGPGATVERGAAITLMVSSGPPPLRVPGVAGIPEAEALDLLTNVGLEPNTSIRETVGVESGIALQTDPPEGSEVESGASVTLFVSCESPCIE